MKKNNRKNNKLITNSINIYETTTKHLDLPVIESFKAQSLQCVRARGVRVESDDTDCPWVVYHPLVGQVSVRLGFYGNVYLTAVRGRM